MSLLAVRVSDDFLSGSHSDPRPSSRCRDVCAGDYRLIPRASRCRSFRDQTVERSKLASRDLVRSRPLDPGVVLSRPGLHALSVRCASLSVFTPSKIFEGVPFASAGDAKGHDPTIDTNGNGGGEYCDCARPGAVQRPRPSARPIQRSARWSVVAESRCAATARCRGP